MANGIGLHSAPKRSRLRNPPNFFRLIGGPRVATATQNLAGRKGSAWLVFRRRRRRNHVDPTASAAHGEDPLALFRPHSANPFRKADLLHLDHGLQDTPHINRIVNAIIRRSTKGKTARAPGRVEPYQPPRLWHAEPLREGAIQADSPEPAPRRSPRPAPAARPALRHSPRSPP
jgi:hypothetical protein